MRLAHSSFLSDIIKIGKVISLSATVQFGAWPPCRLVEVWVECNRDLNASRALLVLER